MKKITNVFSTKRVTGLALLLTSLFSQADPIWESQHPGAGGQHQCVVTDPSVDGRVYICIDMNGIFRSDDSGDSWKNYYTDAANGFAFHLAIDPDDSDIIYSGNFWGVDISTNGGENWTTPILPVPESLESGGGDAVAWLTIDPNNSQNVYAAPGWRVKDNEKRNKDIIWPLQPHDGVRNIYVSTDSGANWQSEIYEPLDGYRQIYSTAVHPQTSQLYIGAHSGVYVRNGANDYTRLSVPAGAVDGLETSARKLGGTRGVTISPDGKWVYALWATEVFYADNGKSEVATELFAYNIALAQWTHISADGKRPAEYANPQIDPRANGEQHKILLPQAYDGPSKTQAEGGNVGRTGLWEYTVNLTNDQIVSDSVELIGEGDGVAGFSYEAGWEHREWKLRGASYTSTKWDTRSIFASGGQQMYRANTEEQGYPFTAWKDIYSKKVENGRYTNRGYAATVNFDATAYGDYAVQNLADLGVYDSFDGGKSWEEIVVWAQSSLSSQIVTAEGETPLSIIHLNRGFGNTAQNKGGLYFKRLNKDLSTSVYTQLAGVNMKYILVTGTGQIRLRGLPNLVYKDQAYDPTSRSLYVATRSGPNAGIYRALDIFKMVNETEETEDKYRNFFRISGNNDSIIAGQTINRLFVDPNNHNQLWIQLHNGAIVKATNSNGWTFTQTPLVDEFNIPSNSAEVNAAKDMYVWDNDGKTYVAVVRGNDLLVSPNAGESFHYLSSANDLSPGVSPGWLDGPGTLDFARWVAGYGDRIYIGLSNYTHRRSGGFYEFELSSNGKNVAQTTNITGDPKSEGYWARSTRANVVDNVTEEGAFLLVPTRGSGLLRYKIGSGNAPAPEIDVSLDSLRITSGSTVELGTVLKDSLQTLTFSLENLGNASLDLTGNETVSITGETSSAYTISKAPSLNIAANNDSSFVVQFMPTNTGSQSVTVSIPNNDISEPDFKFTLSVTVLEAFGAQPLSQLLADNGEASLPHQHTSNDDLELISLGFKFNTDGSKSHSVWKIRNYTDTDKTVTLSSVSGGFSKEVVVKAQHDLILTSPIVKGASVHKLSMTVTKNNWLLEKLIKRFPWLASKFEKYLKVKLIDVTHANRTAFSDDSLVSNIVSETIASDSNTLAQGSSKLGATTFEISGSGQGFNGTEDEFQFVGDDISGDISLFGAIKSAPEVGQFGLIIRENRDANAKSVFVGVNELGQLIFTQRSETSGVVEVINAIDIEIPVWLRIDRKVNTYTASYSTDGTHYQALGTTSIILPFNVVAGFTAASLSSTDLAEVTFEHIGKVSNPDSVPESDAALVVGANGQTIYSGGMYDVGESVIHSLPKFVDFNIANSGTDNLLLTGNPAINLDDETAFSVYTQPLTTSISVAQKQNFEINFSPEQVGEYVTILSFESNDPDESPYSVYLTGYGQRPIPNNGQYAVDTFESGDFDNGESWNNGGWITTIDNDRFFPEVLTSNSPVEGLHHVRIPRSSSMTRFVDLSGGENLALRFNWKGESLDVNSNDGGLVQLDNGEGYKTVFEIDGDDEMTEYKDEVIDLSSFDFSRSGNVGLRFIGKNNGGNEYLFFDNIAITTATSDIDVSYIDNDVPSSSSIDLGAAEVNVDTLSANLTIKSSGNNPLTLSANNAIRIEGVNADEFALTTDLPSEPMETGHSFEVAIEFTPSSAGTKSATLIIESNDDDEGYFELHLTAIGFVSGVVLDANDDFETGTLTGGSGWLDNEWAITIDNNKFIPELVASGSNDSDNTTAVLIPRSASIERRVNTLDAADPTLSFDWKGENWNVKGEDGLVVEVFDGTNWITIFEVHLDGLQTEYQSVSIKLNDYAVTPAADLLIKFRGTNNGGNERSYIDNVTIK